jgi:hypothetical protein
VSLVKEGTIIRGSNIKHDVSCIQGITGNFMQVKGQTKLSIGETSPHDFLAMVKLPVNYDLLLGQDWLEKFGFNLQTPSLGINLPAYSETLVRIPARERGNRIIEAQDLQENVFCASSVVECVDNSFLCLLINLNPIKQTLKHFPQTQKLPKLSCQFQNIEKCESNKRSQILQTQLRQPTLKKEKRLDKSVLNTRMYLNYQGID